MRSKLGLSSLTHRQRITLFAIAGFNFVVLGTLALMLFTDAPTPIAQPAGPDNSVECEQNAALVLRQSGVAGTVTVVGHQLIQVYLTGPDAGAAWNVFSMTVKMAGVGCGPYDLIRVDVPDPEGRSNSRLLVELSWPEVEAWADGKFDDGQLSERMRRRVYPTAP